MTKINMPNDPLNAAVKVLPHPRFFRDWKRLFAGVFAYFALSVGGVIVLGNHGFSEFARSLVGTLQTVQRALESQTREQGLDKNAGFGANE